MKKYIKESMKNRIKTDVTIRLIRNAKQKIHHVLKGTSESPST